ncbi:hypothetical protein Tco_0532289 [Tanacetum coccineum]
MSLSHIFVSSDSMDESVGSSASYVILADSKAAVDVVPAIVLEVAPKAEEVVVASPTDVLDLVLESDKEIESSKASPSLDYIPESLEYAPTSDDDTKLLKALALPEYYPRLDTESNPSQANPKELTGEDASEEDSSNEDTSEADEPLPDHIVHAPPASPRRPTLLVQPGPATEIDITQWITTPPLSLLGSSLSSGPSSSSSRPLSSSSSSGSSRSSSLWPLLSSSSSELLSSSGFSSSSRSSLAPSSLPSRPSRRRVSSYSSPSAASPSPSPSARPSRKRCRSPTSSPSTTIAPAVATSLHADLLPPRKRFTGTPSAPKEDATTEAMLTYHGWFIEEIHDHLREILITRLESTQHELETLRARLVSAQREIVALRAKAEAAELCDERTIPATKEGASNVNIEQIITQRAAEAMEELCTPLVVAHIKNLNYEPRNFSGTEGAVGLARWFEKMESVFHISNYATICQVKYATSTLLDSELTWWNSHVKTIGIDAAYEMSLKELVKMMTELYCPRNEIQKMETELWNLVVKRTDIMGYT